MVSARGRLRIRVHGALSLPLAAAAVNRTPESTPQVGKALEDVIEQARQAITEDRSAIEGLRSSKQEGADLEKAISRFGRELAANQSEPDRAEFHVNVEGATRSLSPILANELCQIAIEALRNAFRHAHARRIDVEVRYAPREFRVRVRDDGKGIEPKVLDGGRDGHYGLIGVRERTRLAGGKLDFWSELGSGTEIELKVLASLAYARDSGFRAATLATKIRRIIPRNG